MTKKTLLLLGFILLKFVLQYSLISSDYDLQRDEYLHLDQGRHLAWGYLSVPPFTSWISYLILLLGGTVFWVKFFPALFGALTIVVVWKAIEELKGNLPALLLGAVCVLFSSLLRLNILYQPNSFDVLCWTAVYLMVIKYINSENTKWLLIGAIVFAYGFLNKYNIGFLFIGMIPALFVTKQRKIFVQPKLYLAVIFGLLLIAPNLFWQFQNKFPVIHHLKELADTQLVYVDRVDFLKSQLFFFIGSFLVIVSGLAALLFYQPFEKYRPFFWSIVFTLMVFMYFKAKDYYAIGLYPIYIAFGSVFLEEKLKNGWKRYLFSVLIVIPMLIFIPMYKADFPNKSPQYIVSHAKEFQKYGLHRWEDGTEHILQQDFADMVGWKELAVKVDSVCRTMPDLEHTLILCDNYGQAGAINYYTANKKVIASSFHADYINWLPLDMKIKNVILVKEKDDDDPDRKVERPLFDTVYLAGKRINKYSRETEISIYVLKGAKVDVSKRIKEEMEEKKNYD
ncbi:glycosyltransferase family 39 protein [Flavobacterium aquicola]|uniref:Dolichyl-phosphate-mannose-protein mannosyltransferase n=1 Tax=Flavobacterium aquicola TaxID=1682742 RepID=A0A3E0EK28_9FLAO|nr:glycosyltransferase family 39 protein [Flavobacterium aquicola]REG98604.1 dolichyl-phosphate-mannose-protein mannosyltransferase [Flavobacterium aquicola]